MSVRLGVRARQVSCLDCPIRHNAVCASCEPSALARLEEIKTYQRFSAGEAIQRAQEPMPAVGSVVSGLATLSHTLSDGRRQMVGLLLPSDFIGRPGRDRSPVDVVAATETLVCQFDRLQFERVIAETPAIERRLLEMVLDELEAAREWMLLLGRKSAREKIASLLVIFARRGTSAPAHADDASIRFELPLTREAMADYLGLTIETVSRQLTGLRKSGIIGLDGSRSVVVPDLPSLLAAAGDDSDGALLG